MQLAQLFTGSKLQGELKGQVEHNFVRGIYIYIMKGEPLSEIGKLPLYSDFKFCTAGTAQIIH